VVFAIGLFKKTVIADNLAIYATPVFANADGGGSVDFFTAWQGALAYTGQLYFDFSGYSDMAIGAARLFGVRLPANFDSPYKATNIVDFWRRWHMTLSRFLRDYLYFPLGGNRKGNLRRYTNLLLTMLLGGLWHGAGWTFVIWGGLHGLYLVVNHAWQRMTRRFNGFGSPNARWVLRRISHVITFLAVVIGWVFFRSETLDGAFAMLLAMSGDHGLSLPNAIGVRLGVIGHLLQEVGVRFTLGGGAQFIWGWLWITGALLVAFVAPNSLDIMSRYRPVLRREKLQEDWSASLWPARLYRTIQRLKWRPTIAWAMTMSLVLSVGFLALSQVSEFLYFQF
jgi:hypothetical protein